MKRICIQCGKEFEGKKVNKFCSQKCKSNFQIGKVNMSSTKFEKGHKTWNKGKKLNYSVWNKGKKGVMPIPWNKGTEGLVKGYWKGKKLSEKHIKKLKEAHLNNPNRYWLGKKRLDMRGKKHFAWKGGVVSENGKIRCSSEARLWRKSCFQRDDFTCQKYGTKGGYLIAHHINNFAEFPELRFAIDNGITLSKKAHDEFHKIYGRKNNTKEQLQEFLCLI